MINEHLSRLNLEKTEYFGPDIRRARGIITWVGKNKGVFRGPDQHYLEHRTFKFKRGRVHPGYKWNEHQTKGKVY
jgi:hypothetical protein